MGRLNYDVVFHYYGELNLIEDIFRYKQETSARKILFNGYYYKYNTYAHRQTHTQNDRKGRRSMTSCRSLTGVNTIDSPHPIGTLNNIHAK